MKPANDEIAIDDPRHEAALRAIVAMHEYWKLDPFGGAIRWLEDTNGRVLIFTRGEYREKLMNAVHENIRPTEQFEYREIELDGYLFTDRDNDSES